MNSVKIKKERSDAEDGIVTPLRPSLQKFRQTAVTNPVEKINGNGIPGKNVVNWQREGGESLPSTSNSLNKNINKVPSNLRHNTTEVLNNGQLNATKANNEMTAGGVMRGPQLTLHDEEELEDGEIVDDCSQISSPQIPVLPAPSPEPTMHHIEDEFFNDLLHINSDEITNAIKSEANDNVDDNNGNETSYERVPENFLDDLLVSDEAIKKEEVKEETEDENVQYNYVLKSSNELRDLEGPKTNHENKRKRNYEESSGYGYAYATSSDIDNSNKRHCNYETVNNNVDSNNLREDDDDETQLLAFKPIKLVNLQTPVSISASYATTLAVFPPISDKHEHEHIIDENLSALTPKENGEKAFQRSQEFLYIFHPHSYNQTLSHGFLFTCTKQHCPDQNNYKNRSPLRKNCVDFEFTSHVWTDNDLRNNGLEFFSPAITRLSRSLCFDINALKNKLKTIKVPAKLQNVRNTMEKQHLENNRLENCSSFLISKTTQTESDDFLDVNIGLRKHSNVETLDMAIQVCPKVGNISVQTNGPGHNLTSDELPIIQLIQKFNDNQLTALQEYAELIINPPPSNSIDRYRLKQHLYDVYANAQKASELQQSIQSPPQSSSQSHVRVDIESTYSNHYNIQDLNNYDNTRQTLMSSHIQTSSINRNIKVRHPPIRDVQHTHISERDQRDLHFLNNNDNTRNKTSCYVQPTQPSSTAVPKFYGRGGKRR